jgi:hypothetical protein
LNKDEAILMRISLDAKGHAVLERPGFVRKQELRLLLGRENYLPLAPKLGFETVQSV